MATQNIAPGSTPIDLNDVLNGGGSFRLPIDLENVHPRVRCFYAEADAAPSPGDPAQFLWPSGSKRLYLGGGEPMGMDRRRNRQAGGDADLLARERAENDL